MSKVFFVSCLFSSIFFAAFNATAVINEKLALTGFYPVTGTTSNYVLKDKDGFVDFSLVVPAMNAEQLWVFDLAKIVSPTSDKLQIFTYEFGVPSNLSLPKQKEKYFLSFTIDKLNFTANLPETGNYNLMAIRGRFPVDDVVDGAQGGATVFELINYFEFLGGGVKNVDVNGPVSGVDISIADWTLSTQVNVQAPQFSNDQVMLALSLFKMGDQFYAADLKRMTSGQSQALASKAGETQYVLSVLMNNSQRSFMENFQGDIGAALFMSPNSRSTQTTQLSYTLSPASQKTQPQFLSLINAPKFTKSSDKVFSTVPSTVAGVEPYATVTIISEYEEGGTSSITIDYKKAVWKNTVMGWTDEITIPQDVLGTLANKPYIVEVIYLGAASATQDSAVDWEKVTHVTRNGLKF